nr:MAG TPA: hypothetical protein [Caudoviricetes sp.]
MLFHIYNNKKEMLFENFSVVKMRILQNRKQIKLFSSNYI